MQSAQGSPQIKPDVKVVSNLDAMVSAPVGVQIHGKIVQIRPMSVRNFAVVSQKLAEMISMKDNPNLTDDDAKKFYKSLFLDVVDNLTIEDIERMETPQILALYQIILDCYAGRAQIDVEKKNVN
jgi:hypothetical protein